MTAAIYLNGATLMTTPTEGVLAIARKAGYAGIEARAERLLKYTAEVRAMAEMVRPDEVLTLNGVPLTLRPDGQMDRELLDAELLPRLRDDDLLVITADHGNDPTTPSTDHAREYVPLLVTGRMVRPGVDLGTRRSFADLGQTLAEIFGVGPIAHGTSFLGQITPLEG